MKGKPDRDHPRLSLCMIVRNEERSLGRCLESVKGIVDEAIVVDTGSEDNTVAVAEGFGARVHSHPWRDDFAEARNASLAEASGDWILVLDADEELERADRGKVRQIIARAAAEGFQMRQRSLMPQGDLQKYEDIYLTRLFRNRPEYRYAQPIHEQIRPSIERHGGRVVKTDLTILHYGYAQSTVQGKGQRALRNLQLLKNAVAAAPADPYLHFQLGVTYKALGDPTSAYASLRKALTLDYESLGDAVVDKLYMKLAQLALAFDEVREAVGYAKESLARNRRNVVSLYVMALGHLLLGEVKQAYPCFRLLRQSSGVNLANHGELDAVLKYCRTVLGKGSGR